MQITLGPQYNVGVLFLTFSALVANPKKNTLHGGQSRSWSAEQGEKEQGKVWQRPTPPRTYTILIVRYFHSWTALRILTALHYTYSKILSLVDRSSHTNSKILLSLVGRSTVIAYVLHVLEFKEKSEHT